MIPYSSTVEKQHPVGGASNQRSVLDGMDGCTGCTICTVEIIAGTADRSELICLILNLDGMEIC